jgi:hypothetical protein
VRSYPTGAAYFVSGARLNVAVSALAVAEAGPTMTTGQPGVSPPIEASPKERVMMSSGHFSERTAATLPVLRASRECLWNRATSSPEAAVLWASLTVDSSSRLMSRGTAGTSSAAQALLGSLCGCPPSTLTVCCNSQSRDRHLKSRWISAACRAALSMSTGVTPIVRASPIPRTLQVSRIVPVEAVAQFLEGALMVCFRKRGSGYPECWR